ncbi:MAG: PEP-CTERM system histidine kinase PrsK [Gammaproteobacteria bacterium]|nr:PEP-CTERM system histidine kinase PrsK [Gammaproteobacteria bacterium]
MEINLSIGFMSYSISFGVYLVMLAIFIIGQRDSPKGKPFIALIGVSVVWSGLLLLSQLGASFAFEFVVVAELLRSMAWIFVLQFAMGDYSSKKEALNFKNLLSPINLFIILLISFVALIFNQNISLALDIENAIFIELLLQFLFPVIGLVIVEQLYRNTIKEERGTVQILCLSAASVFIYDVFVYSNALLWSELNYDYWGARGIINILILPLLVLSAVRNPTLAPRIYISRHAVFHSTTLMVAGSYLVLISVASYFIKTIGGEWGGLLQVAFIFAAILLLAVIFSSTSVRLHIKNYLYANFFSNKYDYRDEWHRFSNTLLKGSDYSINEKALIAVCQIMDSQGGALWLNDGGRFYFAASLGMELNDDQKKVSKEFIVDVLPDKKDVYLCRLENKEDRFFNHIDGAWFALPLWSLDSILGFALFKTPIVNRNLDDEDKELLKTVANHIALFFSQNQASFQLMEAQKFQHISQMTAFLVHDLKTVLSQLVLMSENAKIHKSNPEFIDDMLKTIEHVAKKMQRLILQLKEPAREDNNESFNVSEELKLLFEGYRNQSVKLVFLPLIEPLTLSLNKENFISAVKHIVQNAIDASDKNSQVEISIVRQVDTIFIRIKDEGCGMTEKFISENLFRPFDSSKGVSGMGVGVYQSRQFFRSIGGEVSVVSKVDEGSEFSIEIPIAKQ